MMVINNETQKRYELVENGETAYADYAVDGGVLQIKYVFSPSALRGTGAAGRLMEGIVGAARAQNLKILPICGYAGSWMRKHKEYHDLMA